MGKFSGLGGSPGSGCAGNGRWGSICGIASINAADELLARTDAVVAERVRVSAALRQAGYDLPDSQANFVWLPLGPEHTADFVEQCADGGVLVRPYGTDGVRVTIGAPAENDAFLAIAAQWIAER